MSRRMPLALVLLIVSAVVWYLSRGNLGDRPYLVVYCAHDAVFADEILREFERQSGIRVIAKYDSEATKSLGFVNLLVQEKDVPQCDVFWNNELLGMCELQEQGVLTAYRGSGYARIPDQFRDPEGFWVGFAARLRVFIVNTEKMNADLAEIEARLQDDADLTRVAIAQPLFGTTLTQYTLWHHVWGADRLRDWHADVRRRGLREVKGNSATKDLVADGACDFAFTDNDDYFVARDAGRPVAMLPVRIDGRTCCIPNSVAIIRGTPRSDLAQQLVDYLLSAETELRLARSESRQIPLGPINAGDLPDDVRPLVAWAADGADLRPLLSDRRAVIAWLKSEYLK
ncbi:MAG: substrate-binding domain-containing protein [Planctomycetes bacterium]|nr:substrate-binding domain-containing protein [Planctomycetota bacterium]